jgi:hypothetical protein
VVEPAIVASTRPARYGRLRPPQRLFDITLPRATRSATIKLSVVCQTMRNFSLTRHRIINKRSPKSEAIVECAAGIFAPRCFKSYACVYTTSSCTDIRGYEIVEQYSYPLSSSRATALECRFPCFSDIVCAWCNRRRKVRSVCAPIVDEDVFEEICLNVRIIEGRVNSAEDGRT